MSVAFSKPFTKRDCFTDILSFVINSVDLVSDLLVVLSIYEFQTLSKNCSSLSPREENNLNKILISAVTFLAISSLLWAGTIHMMVSRRFNWVKNKFSEDVRFAFRICVILCEDIPQMILLYLFSVIVDSCGDDLLGGVTTRLSFSITMSLGNLFLSPAIAVFQRMRIEFEDETKCTDHLCRFGISIGGGLVGFLVLVFPLSFVIVISPLLVPKWILTVAVLDLVLAFIAIVCGICVCLGSLVSSTR
jgi:cytochrome bd-type quinol oxidase subunit 1